MNKEEKKKFAHLHLHTHYSLLDGLGKIPEILDKAKEYGMESVAITDHGVMYGAIEFYKEAKKREIKPIIGCEMYVAPRGHLDKTPRIDAENYHLILLAKNEEGYKNLLKLVSIAHLDGYYYKPRVDKELLKKYHKGLIAMSACMHGEVPKAILSGNIVHAEKIALEYKEIFGEGDFYLEVQHHPSLPDQAIVNKALVEISKKTGISLVATKDTHYINPEDKEAQEVLICLQTGVTVENKDRMVIEGDLSFPDEKTMREYFFDIPEAVDNTSKIAEKCNLDLKLGELFLPDFPIPEGYTLEKYLKRLCYVGCLKKFGGEETEEKTSDGDLEKKVLQKIDKNVLERLNYEMGVVNKSGFAGYFLIVADFVNWAKNNKVLVGPGRGSAAGSMVAYVLDITNLNPLDYDLLFERFLNPERISAPDIDMDFADDTRGKVIEYVTERYGKDHVAQIITFGTMAARMAVRDTGRVLGFTYNEVDRVAKLIPMSMSLSEAIENTQELKELYNGDLRIRKMLELTKKLEGVARHASTHAAGVVISREPLVEYVPLQRATKGDISTVTQYSMNYLEPVGLLKMDFLGLANLSIMGNAIRIIKKVYNMDIDLNNLPLDDEATYKTLQRAETTGVFQLESDGMKRYLKELKPTVFEDIIAMCALYRPGPLAAGFVDMFVRRKNGKEKITYDHPDMEPILKTTYGVTVYQEQVMQISQKLAGFTGGQADTLRKAIGKKIATLLAKMEKEFIDGCKKNKISDKVAGKIWNDWQGFAEYAFNKSHSACYAMIAYQTAYLKTHYPEAFMAALMTSDKSDLDRIAKEIGECKDMGIQVAAPDINESFMNFAIVPGEKKIRYALSAIKNVGEGPIGTIEEARKKEGKFTSLEDFVKRTAGDEINKKTLESLIKCGAIDCLGKKRSQLLASLDQILNYAQSIKKNRNAGQIDIFGTIGNEPDGFDRIELANIDEVSDKQKLDWEKELIGIYVSSHPLDPYREVLSKAGRTTVSINEKDEGKDVKLAGVIIKIQKIITRSKEPMLFVTIEDLQGTIELLVFPKTLSSDPAFWQEGKVILINGKISNKDGVPKMLVDKFEEFNPALVNVYKTEIGKEERKNNEMVIIKLGEGADVELLNRMKRIFFKHEGTKGVILCFGKESGCKKVKTSFKIRFDSYFKNDLRTVLGYEPEFSEIVFSK